MDNQKTKNTLIKMLEQITEENDLKRVYQLLLYIIKKNNMKGRTWEKCTTFHIIFQII